MTVPKCPSCSKDAVKAKKGNSNVMVSLNKGYYITCGDKECIKINKGEKIRKTKVGVKFITPSIPSISSLRIANENCHRCGNKKSVKGATCQSKECLNKAMNPIRKVIGSFISMQKYKKKRNVFLKKKRIKETDDFFEKMNKRAKKVLDKS